MKKDKVFTKKEILKVAELAESFNNEMVAKHFGLTPAVFCEIRKRQPELENAYYKGAETRKINKSAEIKKRNKEKRSLASKNTGQKNITEKMLGSTLECLVDDPIEKFKKEFEERKQRRLREELTNLNLI